MIRIVLADPNEKYLMPLEEKFIEAFDDRAEINVITDQDYLRRFFSTPQSLDILIIHEDFYDASIERHGISSIFILSEKMDETEGISVINAQRIYKYSSVKEIYNEIVNKSTNQISKVVASDKETKVIMVYSPIGGSGKTTIAAGLSAVLSNNHKKVLFIGTDNLQSFGYIMKNQVSLKNGIEKYMSSQDENLYHYIKTLIVQEQFDIFPPFPRALSSLNVKITDYIYLAQVIKASNTYDYIIIDSVSDFTEGISRLMGNSNQTIIITEQDKNSVYKLDCLLKNIDCSDENRFYFMCNKYQQDSENELVTEERLNKFRITEYVAYEMDKDMLHYKNFQNNSSMARIALTLL